MTVEHRLLFDLADIVAVVCECSRCKVRLSVDPKKLDVAKLQECPSCGARWLSGDNKNVFESLNPLARFAAGIPDAVTFERTDESGIGVKLLLEYRHPQS